MTEPLRVLLVKANQHLCEELASKANERGWDFSYSLNGADGIEKAEQSDFDVIVTDAILPDVSGFSVLSAVREIRPQAAIIIISGSETIADTLEHLDRQVVDYLIKPVTAAELAAVISKTASRCGLISGSDIAQPVSSAATPDSRQLLSLESEVARQGRYLAEIIDNAPEAVFTVDSNGIIESWNRGAEEIFGYPRSEAVGQPVTMLVPGRLIELGEPDFLIEKIRTESCIRNYDTERVTKQGQTINIDMTLSELKNDAGEFAGSLTILRDATEKKNMERTLLRTEKLATVGQMAAHLAHEVRNPLNSVILNLDLIRDEFNEYEAEGKMNLREATGLLDAIQKEIIGLTAVTNDYLEFTRTYEEKDESVSINRLVGEIIHFYEKEMSARAIEVNGSMADNLPLVLCNRHKIKQALLNVIKNSIEAMPDGGLLEIKTRSREHCVVVSVRDSGGGIEAGTEDKIFHPFHTTKHYGTGLGLSYALQVVQHHHGTMRFDNRPGEGVTFIIELPFEQVPLDGDAYPAAHKEESST